MTENNKILVIIDMQNDFCTGSLKNDAAVKIIPAIAKRLDFYRKNNYQIIYTMDTHFDNYLDTPEGKQIPIKHCIKNTWGWNIVDELKPLSNDDIIEKNEFKWNGNWSTIINTTNINNIEIVGTCTDICVISNAFSIAKLSNVKVNIIANECAGLTPEKHQNALNEMEKFANIVYN